MSAACSHTRLAGPEDLDELVRLENAAFVQDRLSRRSLRHLLTRGHAVTLVDELDGRLRGYVLLLLRQGTSLVRLYSIAVDPAWQGRGVAAGLVRAAEAAALEREGVSMRLEIRRDNTASLALFQGMGYRAFGVYEDYYEDDMDALRLEKHLAPHLDPALARVPFYRQTLDFTCGPAALMMAMKALDPSVPLDRSTELRVWRESTTIYMTSGHGGCGPEGLALAAHSRGFRVELHLNYEGPMLIDSVRSAEKKTVIQLVHEDFMSEVREVGIPVHYGPLRVSDLEAAAAGGAIPVMLISLYRIYRERIPHWVVITGFDEHYVYVHDPWVDEDTDRSATDCINLPILRRDFDRMARYGRSGQRAVVMIHPATASEAA
jgi:ribosomal protein S18 acetylase RimI-like enzyme